MKKVILILICLLLSSGCSLFVSKVANIQDINSTTGKYSIGTKRFVLTDSTRANWFLDDYNKDRRTLMTQIWYPANSDSLVKKSQYIDNTKALTHTIRLQGYDVPEILSNQIAYVDCNSWEDAYPVQDTKFPVIIFSHGHGGLRTQNTNQVEELVSHGYIVISVDHTFDAGFIEFPDGSVKYSLTARPNEDRIKETPEQFYTRFGYRADDIDFLIEQINNFNAYDDKIFSIINQDYIGIFGHSFGGMTSFYSGFHNPQIKSCYSLDGWFEPMPDTLVAKNINKPIFQLGQNNQGEIKYWNDLNYQKLEQIANNNSNLSIIIDIPGSYHYDYTDFPYFSYLSKKLNFSGSVSTETMAKIMNTTLVDFFDYTLKNKNKIDLDSYKEKYPEINIVLEK